MFYLFYSRYVTVAFLRPSDNAGRSQLMAGTRPPPAREEQARLQPMRVAADSKEASPILSAQAQARGVAPRWQAPQV